MTSSAPLARYLWRWTSIRSSTIFRLRSRTAAMSIGLSAAGKPNSAPRRRYEATFAEWMTFLLGRQATFGHDPPTYRRSTTATRFPSDASVHARYLPTSPLPRMTTSYCSGFDTVYPRSGASGRERLRLEEGEQVGVD